MSDPLMLARRLVTELPRFGYRFANEKQLQEALARVLGDLGIEFDRERILGNDRFDFFCADGVVIEVKIDGSLSEALRQVDRYCGHDEIRAVVLVSSRQWGTKVEPLKPYMLRNTPVFLVLLMRQAF